jgi:hypothetical protein
MVSFLVLAMLATSTVVLAVLPGLGLFALVPGVALVLYTAVAAGVLGTHAHPGSPLRRVEHPDLLGPGGPDDPERDA